MDDLPERTHYQDEGCSIAPACLSCPLPECRYDNPRWAVRFRKEKGKRFLAQSGWDVSATARKAGVTERTAYRWLKEASGSH